MSWLIDSIVELMERGRVPDGLVRAGIRRLCARRLRSLAADGPEAFARTMRDGPVAPVPHRANEQHYELPPEFFDLVLGRQRKYSCAWWPAGVETLDEAEARALDETCRRAGIEDGMDVLELGCGWGSLTLRLARRYPDLRITAVSNSHAQRRRIMEIARAEGLDRLRVITADMNDLRLAETFDRVVSVEMFEHMRNYEVLFGRIAGWLRPGGLLFLHVFAHRRTPYEFTTEGSDDWMGRHFFTGGIMPTPRLLHCFDDDLRVAREWWWDGTHYERTANAWLANLDARRDAVMPILEQTYGPRDAERWRQRWRIFFMACAELFGFRDGTEWGVAHAVLEPVGSARLADPAPAAVVA